MSGGTVDCPTAQSVGSPMRKLREKRRIAFAEKSV